MQAHRQTKAVEERQRAEYALARLGRIGGRAAHLPGLSVDVAVGEQDALGRARCAAGEQDGGGLCGEVALVKPHLDTAAGLAQRPALGHKAAVGARAAAVNDLAGRQVVLLRAEAEDAARVEGELVDNAGGDDADGGAPGARGCQLGDLEGLLVEDVHGDEQLGAGELERVLELCGREQRVDHAGDGADLAHRVEGHGGLRAVGEHNGHHIASAYARVGKRSGTPVHVLHQCGVAELAAEEVEGDVLGVAFRRLAQRPEERAAVVVTRLLHRRGDWLLLHANDSLPLLRAVRPKDTRGHKTAGQ